MGTFVDVINGLVDDKRGNLTINNSLFFFYHGDMGYQIHDGWLMVSWGMKYYPLYIGDCNNPRTGNPARNQRGLNGMREGFRRTLLK